MAKDKFEDSLSRLEDLVRKLEGGDLSLDDSLKAFEEGIRLVRSCSKKLEEAERRIEMLVRDDSGRPATVPFAEDPTAGGADA